MSAAQFTITWVDAGREPQCQPDPDFPEGKHVRAPEGVRACQAALPYPARRCGHYVVECRMCGCRVVVTTAGRPDDPRSIEVPCRGVAGGMAQ